MPPARVLITGSAGFTGRHLVGHLRAHEPDVRLAGFDRRAGAPPVLERRFVGDAARGNALREAIAAWRPDVVIHLAGSVAPAAKAELWLGNLAAAVNLFQSLHVEGLLCRVLVIGSAAEYGPVPASPIAEDQTCRPLTDYGRAKLAQTLLARASWRELGLPVVVARPFNLVGPGMSASSLLGTVCAQLAQRERGGRLLLGNLDGSRDFLDVRDAVAAYWELAHAADPGEIYNVCSGVATPLGEAVRLAVTLSGREIAVESSPARVRSGDVEYSCGDPAKIERRTAWRPERDLATSLRDALEWFSGQASAGQATQDAATGDGPRGAGGAEGA